MEWWSGQLPDWPHEGKVTSLKRTKHVKFSFVNFFWTWVRLPLGPLNFH